MTPTYRLPIDLETLAERLPHWPRATEAQRIARAIDDQWHGKDRRVKVEETALKERKA
jgi:hypothetical protein